ncbi:DUF4282 domain-containing protein [Lacihabitans sp. LS3-19]|uniref:DUF4282 domain-containing protein n=1 Tax=Lacihabitans sp. LS3-19 TaxID=2487335 RepID=UPI0020CCA5DB|nr:DUF4282 domain-containing protein [Lacihabitans sp. LS3-19]MCP9767082.1 DUF4282 domain-containing protein [Lacihabitans sp. LS3-19]
MKLEDFLKFDKMITPTIITIIYYFLAGIAILSGVVLIIRGISADWGGGMMVFWGLITLVAGPIWARITCELMIVLFKIHGRLSSIDEKTK